MNPYILIDPLPDVEDEQFIPKIFDGGIDNIPAGFNAVTIALDGKADSTLDWKMARQHAIQAVSQGMKICWEIDLGLFSRLPASIMDQTQFLTLALSLDHFCEQLWSEFKSHTIAICLYRGSADFSLQLCWDQFLEKHFQEWLEDPMHAANKHPLQVFCRDVGTDYLQLLAQKLPGGLAPAVFLSSEGISEGFYLAQMVSKERLNGIARFLTDGVLPAAAFSSLSQNQLGFCSTKLIEAKNRFPNYGICLPASSQPILTGQYQEAINQLKEQGKEFRFVHEATLTEEWHGLDYLLVMQESVSTEGKRKLLGFRAAGGVVVPIA